MPPDARSRKGVQPVVTLTGNDQRGRLLVKRGEAVKLVAYAECPPGSGFLSTVEWDFDGSGQFTDQKDEVVPVFWTGC